MKRTTTLAELRALDRVALDRRLAELDQECVRARLAARFGSVKNHQALRVLRRTVAQAKTLKHARYLTDAHALSTGRQARRLSRSGSGSAAEESR